MCEVVLRRQAYGGFSVSSQRAALMSLGFALSDGESNVFCHEIRALDLKTQTQMVTGEIWAVH